MNIIYDAELTEFKDIATYTIFRFNEELYMKIPVLPCEIAVADRFTELTAEPFKKNYNAIKLHAERSIEAYADFANSAAVKVLDCDLVIKEQTTVKDCKDCIYEKDCALNTEACERFKNKDLFSTYIETSEKQNLK